MRPSADIGVRARIPNRALQPLEFLIGEWRTNGLHPLAPGKTLLGRAFFAWHEGGAFLIMRAEVDEPRFPNGRAIIGSDDSSGMFVMNYFDERGVSRLYEVAVGDRTITWRRVDRELSQSTAITATGEDRPASIGRMSQKGGPWTDDLSQDFTRE